MRESETVGFVFMIITIVIGLIVFGVKCWMEERALTQLIKCCTTEKVLSVLKANNIHFGCWRAGVFVMDKAQIYLEVVVSRAPSVLPENEKTTTARKQPKNIYHIKHNLNSMSYVIEFLFKHRSDNRVVHAEFYQFRSSTADDQSVNEFLQEWISFFNDYRYQNEGEKQYFQHGSIKPEDVLQIDHGVNIYDAASTHLPPKVSISGNGKMIVHGDVTF